MSKSNLLIEFMHRFNGNFLSVPSPLTDDARSVSEARTYRMIRSLKERGIQGLQVCGDAGEFLALGQDERKLILEWTIREAQADIPVIANVSSLATHLTVDLARHAGQSGARAVVVSSPYSGIYTAEEAAQHLKTVASFCSIPVLVIGNRLFMQEHAFDSLRTIPHVTVVEGKSWDCWQHDEFACQISAAYSELLGTDRVIVDKLVSTYGASSFAKAALHHLDIEVGSLRAPKLPIPASLFSSAIPKVA